ncbi:MAG: signal recognition particle-docking protein FtsY [Bacillota bacterium]|nr:signal recognition particle-docking protein FtsY [Bacillota bacterium]
MFKNWFHKEEEEKDPVSRLDAPKKNLFDRLVDSLQKTRAKLTEQIDEVIKGYAKIDEELFEDLEDILVSADVGVQTTMTIMDGLRERVRTGGITDPAGIKELLSEQMVELIREQDGQVPFSDERPLIVLIIGVNGVGKTTSIGKLAYKLKTGGDTVLLAAADTFRAAAIDQLQIWAERAGTDIVYQQEGADPASVIYDGIAKMRASGADVLLCDTAGRLHNKGNLMKELGKIRRVIDREYPDAQKETLLVLDATTGQNALSQAKEFTEVADPTGIILTKLDGTAKGGVIFPLLMEYRLPVKFIGIGEGIDDVEPFDAESFVRAIFS